MMALMLEHVTEALAQAALEEGGGASGSTTKIMSYFQISLRPQLPSKMRDQRELETLARGVDLLREGRLDELRAGRSSLWPVHGRGERGPDGVMAGRSVLGSGSFPPARCRSIGSIAGSSATREDGRKGCRKRNMAEEPTGVVGSLRPKLWGGASWQKQRERRKRKGQEQERQRECIEGQADRESAGTRKVKRRRVDPHGLDVSAVVAPNFKAALAVKHATEDPYELWEMNSDEEDYGASLKAALSMEVQPDESETVQDDPYTPFAVSEEPSFSSQPCAGPMSVTGRDSSDFLHRLCAPVQDFGIAMLEGVSDPALARESRILAELLAPSGASSSDSGIRSRRRWKLFPLPVDFEGCLEDIGSKKSLDRGARVWTNFACLGLNALAGEKGPFPRERVSKQVVRVLGSIGDRVERFLEGCKSQPLDPKTLWEDLVSKRLGYDGDEIAQPEPLSYCQILKSVPPPGHGGSVPLAPLLVGGTRWQLEHPESCVLPPCARTPGPNTAAVHIVPGQEREVWGLLEERGVIEWMDKEEVFRDENGPFLSGIFGVPKSGRFDEQGRQILRVVMNLKPINRVLRTLHGDIEDLPSAPVWCQLVLCPQEEVAISQGDMASVYLFLLPPSWRKFFGFNSSFPSWSVGGIGNKEVVPVCRVLPMGWASSVGLMQMLSRQLLKMSSLHSEVELRRKALTPPCFVEEALRLGGEQWYQVYLDNFMSVELKDKGVNEGGPSRLHAEAMQAWDSHGVLNVPEKHVIGAPVATELGIRIDGKRKLIGAGGDRVHKLLVVTWMLLQQKQPCRRWVQIVLGRWIFVLQFKRQGMAMLSQCWRYLKVSEDKRRWWGVVQRELFALLLISPLLQMDVSTTFHPVASCSDASESGGAVACSLGLTPAGSDMGGRLRDCSLEPITAPVLVLSLFNGVGGAFRCFDLAGIAPIALVSVECDAAAQRVTRRAWPQAIEVDDVKKVTRELLVDWGNRFPRVLLVLVVAGFPCVHLSRVRSGRKNLEGEGSNLFWELVRILRLAEECFHPEVRVEFVVENVSSMDISARDEISRTLQVEPVPRRSSSL